MEVDFFIIDRKATLHRPAQDSCPRMNRPYLNHVLRLPVFRSEGELEVDNVGVSKDGHGPEVALTENSGNLEERI